jgi:hypothetical protein
MKPSSSIASAIAVFACIQAFPALAGASATATFVSPVRSLAIAPPSRNETPVRLGAATRAATLGAPRDRGHRHWRHHIQPDTPLVYVAPPAAGATTSEPEFRGEDGFAAPRRVSCFKPRIIEIAPVKADPRPAPRVIYGSPSPCSAGDYARGWSPAAE